MPGFVWYSTRYPRVCQRNTCPFVWGKFSQLARGNSGLMVVKGTDQQKIFQELRLFAMTMEKLPIFKDFSNGTFPNSVHEGVHEEDVSYCTTMKSY
ncbi:hypothetical protein TNCV_2636151 [Trichonephila clavipes]|nr:hypothetical protein TNCV_2636151 [Trichonephila clavipes]